MTPVLSRAQIQALDQHAIEVCHVPSCVLMENAGRGAAEILDEHLIGHESVLIVCGGGNNGGDGLVVARHMLRLGYDVFVALLVDPEHLKNDSKLFLSALKGLGGEVHLIPETLEPLEELLDSADVVVDALFGTGLSRPLEGRFRKIVELLNQRAPWVAALDIPSGLCAQTGAPLGVSIHADLTISFAHPKLGHFSTLGARSSGELIISDIGVPDELSAETGCSAWISDLEDVHECLENIPDPRHKGDAGSVLVVAGAPGTLGAGMLVARAALRAGAGLARIATFPEGYGHLQSGALELMTCELNPQNAWESLQPWLAKVNTVIVGPGFGLSTASKALMLAIIERCHLPVVVDADALTALAVTEGGPGLELVARAAGPRLLTPHPLEAARLLGTNKDEVELDRFGSLHKLVARARCPVLLKGQYTLIGAPGELPWINPKGSSALATAGSGDVLAGVVGALGCHLQLQQAAICGAWVHGSAAETWVERTRHHRGLLSGELADLIPTAIAQVVGGSRDV